MEIHGPGLVGALLVGVAEAKAIAYAKKLPLVGVHHIEGHVSANYIEHPDRTAVFMFDRFRWTYSFGNCKGLWCF